MTSPSGADAYRSGLMFPYFGAGRCINCGFLGKNAGSEFYPASAADRARGRFDRHDGGTFSVHGTNLWCFVNAAQLAREADEYTDEGETPNVVLTPQPEIRAQRVIQKARNCPEFTVWVPFLSPQEHYQRRRQEWDEENRRTWERELDESRRAFEEQLLTKEQAMRDATERAEGRFNRRFTIVAVLLGAGEVITAVLALAYPDGIDWLVRMVP